MKARRRFLFGTDAAGGVLLASAAARARATAAVRSISERPAEAAARDETLWAGLREHFQPAPGHRWFNCLALNPAASPVHDAFINYDRQVNRWPVTHTSQIFGKAQRDALRSRLGSLINACGDEIALMGNTTEALVTVINGLELRAGDEVVISDQDYEPMLNAWKQREARLGIILRQVTLPTPAASHDELVQAYRLAITPRSRLVSCNHISDETGQIFPVRRICDLAHAAGAQLFVDGALSFRCIPLDVKEMDCDYYATSLHKGVFAPTGTGFLYVRKDRIGSLWPLHGAPHDQEGNIRKFEYRGTSPVTAFAAVNDALDFHGTIGVERFAARYRYLKRSWADRLVDQPRVHFSARLEPEHDLPIPPYDTRRVGCTGRQIARCCTQRAAATRSECQSRRDILGPRGSTVSS